MKFITVYRLKKPILRQSARAKKSAKEAVIDPVEALNSLISKLCRPWDEPRRFFLRPRQ